MNWTSVTFCPSNVPLSFHYMTSPNICYQSLTIKKLSMLSFNVIKVSVIASAKPFWFVFLYKSFSLNLV